MLSRVASQLKNERFALKSSNFVNFGLNMRRSSRSAFTWSTGNDVSGHYKQHSFLFFLFFSPSRCLLFSYKEYSD